MFRFTTVIAIILLLVSLVAAEDRYQEDPLDDTPFNRSRCNYDAYVYGDGVDGVYDNYELTWGYSPDSSIWIQTSDKPDENNVIVRYVFKRYELYEAAENYKIRRHGGDSIPEDQPFFISIHLGGFQIHPLRQWETEKGIVIEERYISPFFGVRGENVYTRIYRIGDFELKFRWFDPTLKEPHQNVLPSEPGYVDFWQDELEVGDSVYVFNADGLYPRDQNGYLLPHVFKDAYRGIIVEKWLINGIAYEKGEQIELPLHRYKMRFSTWEGEKNTTLCWEVVPQQKVAFFHS
ncbi:hypothetical protein KKF32_02835 [Patescibacteria group bacterium]|nr:hypothetical protein [Patescibacteria group bacterium]